MSEQRDPGKAPGDLGDVALHVDEGVTVPRGEAMSDDQLQGVSGGGLGPQPTLHQAQPTLGNALPVAINPFLKPGTIRME